jgi:small subunit ribosomal protein S17
MADEKKTNEEAAEQPVAEEAADQPVRASGPGEGAPGEPGSSPDAEASADEPAPEVPAEAADEPPATEAEEAEAPVAEAPPQSEPKKKRKRLPRAERRQRPKTPREKPAERKPITRLPKPESERGRRQERRGVVVSSAMDKTIIVKVDTIKAHARYKKVVRRSVKFHAHDEQNTANVGDIVRIVETRPLSKTKNWRLVEVVEAAK